MAWINNGCLLCNSCGLRKQKSTLWTMQVGIFDVSVDDILHHLWIIAQSWFSQKRLRIHSIERLALNVAKRSLATICSRASLTLGLPYRFAFESVPELNTQLWKRRTANNGGWNIRCFCRLYFLPLVNHNSSVLNSQSKPFAYPFD